MCGFSPPPLQSHFPSGQSWAALGQVLLSTSDEEDAHTEEASGTDLQVKKKERIIQCLLHVFFKKKKKLVNRCLFPTLSVTVRLPVQCKLAGIVQHQELLQQALDDFTGGGQRANVDLLHTVRWQVEGCSLVTRLTVRPFLAFQWCLIVATHLPGCSVWALGLHGGDCDWSTEPQVDVDEASEGSVWRLKYTGKMTETWERRHISVLICALNYHRTGKKYCMRFFQLTFWEIQYSLCCRELDEKVDTTPNKNRINALLLLFHNGVQFVCSYFCIITCYIMYQLIFLFEFIIYSWKPGSSKNLVPLLVWHYTIQYIRELQQVFKTYQGHSFFRDLRVIFFYPCPHLFFWQVLCSSVLFLLCFILL